MLEKAIRKAVLPILLASLMVGAGCRITYAEEQQQTTEIPQKLIQQVIQKMSTKTTKVY